jgi:hypothetical protein
MVPASEKDPEGWSAAVKLKVLQESAGLHATELGSFCRKRLCYTGKWSVGVRPCGGGSADVLKNDPGLLGED